MSNSGSVPVKWPGRSKRLAGVLEPLAAYGRFVSGRAYPAGPLAYAWRKLLQNHPHDSICGCSIDEVHEEMLPRFDAVEQTAEQCVCRQMIDLAPTFAPKHVANIKAKLAAGSRVEIVTIAMGLGLVDTPGGA